MAWFGKCERLCKRRHGLPSSSRPLLRLFLPRCVSPLLADFPNTGLTEATCAGVLFICFNVDYRVLHTQLTDEVVGDAFQFYATFFNAPPAIKVRAPLSTDRPDAKR